MATGKQKVSTGPSFPYITAVEPSQNGLVRQMNATIQRIQQEFITHGAAINNLPTGNLDNANGASNTTWWRGDGIWRPVIRADWVDPRSFNAQTAATDNSTALQAAINSAQSTNTPLYIPSGIWKYATTLSFTAQSPVPIFGDGKTKSILLYTGAGEAINYTQPAPNSDPFVSINTAYSNGDGHVLQDIAVEPSVAGAGTYGIHIVANAAGTYRHFHWQNVRVGQFGTYSVYLDNSGNNANAIASGTMADCDFINSINGVLVGDTVKFDNCRIDGIATATFTQPAGAGSLILNQCSITTTGGVYFNGCGQNTTLNWCEFEIFVAGGYTGGQTAMVNFNNTVSANVANCNIGVVSGGGTRPAYTVSFVKVQNVRYGGNTLTMGTTGYIIDDGTTNFVIDKGDNFPQTAGNDSHSAAMWGTNLIAPHGSAVAYNTSTATTSVTLTPQNITGGETEVILAMTGALGAAANIQLPTATNVYTLLGNNYPPAAPHMSYRLRIINESSNAFAWTVTSNTGWTLQGTMSIAQNTWREFAVIFATTSTATLQSIGTGTYS